MAPEKDWLHELAAIMARLRGPDGCPWDREQTHASLQRYLIEEAYELLDAIDAKDDENMAEELGDVLLQVVFHSQIAAEEQRFDLQTVARVCCEKLIRRHPHVFADAQVDDAAGVLRQWEVIKQTEKASQTPVASTLDRVPRHLPGLSRAHQMQRQAAKLGFDWPDTAGVVAKVEEEWAELRHAMQAGDQVGAREELGDLLFAVVNLSRFMQEEPEQVMRQAIAKFYRRFRYVEQRVAASGKPFAGHSPAELDGYWEDAKRQPPTP